MSRYNFRESEAKWQRIWRDRGSFAARDCVRLDDALDREAIAGAVYPLDRALPDWRAMVLSDSETAAVRVGQAVSAGPCADGKVRLYDGRGAFLALADSVNGWLKPYRVFDGGR